MPYLKRRRLLQSAALLALPQALHAGGSKQDVLLLSAVSDPDDQHWLVGAELRGSEATLRYQQRLPGRGHHVAVHESLGCYVAVARRPGNWLVVGTLATGEVQQHIEVPQGRHLYGHGVFSASGDRFYTTESAFEDRDSDNGLLVEWHVEQQGGRWSLQRAREFSTQGIGPHELMLMPDGDTLVIANGGMRTHPATEREVLNLDSMQPSLVYLDRHRGQVLEQQFLPAALHQNSMRHLDVNAAGMVVVGLQFQGEPWQSVPLVLTHRRGEALRLLEAPPQVQPTLQQYVGSVRFSADGRYLVASCPRGNQLVFWRADDGAFVHAQRARDACGVSPADKGFVYSSGVGKLASIDLDTLAVTELSLPETWRGFWDNHLSTSGQWPA